MKFLPIFWNFQLSYPIDQFIDKGSDQDLLTLRKSFERLEQAEHTTDEKVNLEQKELANELNQNKINWAYADFLADSPKKSLGQAHGNELISHQIHQHLGDPKQEMDLIAAYFVPTKNGTDFINQFPKQNVKVRILTNSFMANDVALVHAFYQKYRVDLLKGGAKLYEFKPYIERNRRTWYEVLTGNIIPKKRQKINPVCMQNLSILMTKSLLVHLTLIQDHSISIPKLDWLFNQILYKSKFQIYWIKPYLGLLMS